MITGHLGVAAGARSLVREPLRPAYFFLLLGASVAPDVADVLYWAAGICSPYGLYSHTLHAVVLQAALIGGVAWLVTGSRSVTILFVVVVLVHMAGDWFTGRKLFAPGAEMMGLRLYDLPVVDWLLEVPILVGGWLMLRRSGRGPGWATSIWALLLMVILQSAFDAFSSPKGGGLKPNACPVVAPPVSPALVPSA